MESVADLMFRIFDQPERTDTMEVDCPIELEELSSAQILEGIDWILQNPDQIRQFSGWQIGQGLTVIFHPADSDLSFAYINKQVPMMRRAEAVSNLARLYSNYFEKFCAPQIDEVGGGTGGPFRSLCYMFWDIFVVYPGNSEPEVIKAGANVMREALLSHNQSCIVSALHGLGHWICEAPELREIVDHAMSLWSDTPNFIVEYAREAATGYVQ